MTTLQDQFNAVMTTAKTKQPATKPLPVIQLRRLIDAADVVMVNHFPNYQMSAFAERPNLVGLRFNADDRVMFDTTQEVVLNRAGEAMAISTHKVLFVMAFKKLRTLTEADILTPSVARAPQVQRPAIEVANES